MQSVLADFAQARNLDWDDESTGLEFAKSRGISRFVEVPSRNLLIPALVKKELEFLGEYKLLRFYRLMDTPKVRIQPG